jgi:hypothetical protein
MKTIALISLITFFTTAFACPNDSIPEEAALRELYADNEVVNYVCGPSKHCSAAEFSSQLDVARVTISAGAAAPDGFAVSPKVKGTLYFTTLFLKEGCVYKNVLYPDLSSSGLKILRKVRNGKYVVRSTDRDSRSEWSETDYEFDQTKGVYAQLTTRCFAFIAGRVVAKSCE